MCGIAITTHSRERASQLRDSLTFRGPDDQRLVTVGSVHLVHTRLAIVDADDPRSSQPYSNGGASLTAFNGEIFNYRDLDPELTEVELLSHLMHAQHDLAQILNGYYAIIFYDIGRNEIVLARDVFGVMPLYYSIYDGEFEASSIKNNLKGRVRAVPANSRVTYSLKTKKLKIKSFSQPFRLSCTRSTTMRLAFRFQDAVLRVASHSDAGFDVALSGGLDSSLVLAAIDTFGLVPKSIITTYTQTDDPSEVERARELVQQYGWEDLHQVVPVKNFTEEEFRPFIETPPNPIRDFAFKRHATVASVAKSKVILCGEGADELGLGYPLDNLSRKFDTPVSRYFKKISLLKSQATMTLDRVNKAGMMFGKEYRVPFLDLNFVQDALSVDQTGKSVFREMASMFRVPQSIIDAPKYSGEEQVGRAVQTQT